VLSLISHHSDIFYADVPLYQSQKTLDDAVEDIACLFHVPREALNVVPTNKGVVSGCIEFQYDAVIVDCRLAPSSVRIHVAVCCSMTSRRVLLFPRCWRAWAVTRACEISADAQQSHRTRGSCSSSKRMQRLFHVIDPQRLADASVNEMEFTKRIPSILVTGKGYPDVATRFALFTSNFCSLSQAASFDVWRVSCTFRFSVCLIAMRTASKYSAPTRLALQQCRMQNRFRFLKWSGIARCGFVFWFFARLGLHPQDIPELPREALITQTASDKRKLELLVQRASIQSKQDWLEQAQLLLDQNYKAEIQAIANSSKSGLVDYLFHKLQTARWLWRYCSNKKRFFLFKKKVHKSWMELT
jgi:hypothetical protein